MAQEAEKAEVKIEAEEKGWFEGPERPDKDTIKPPAGSKHEKAYRIPVALFLFAVLLYSFYMGQLLWGIVAAVLILRLLFLTKQEAFYFREREIDEEELGTPLDPELKRKRRLANIVITFFALAVVLFSYFTFQFRWGIIAGLMILLYLHMLLFSGERF